MAHPECILKLLGYFNNPLYDPLDKHLRLSDTAHELYREMCLKVIYCALLCACAQFCPLMSKDSSFGH